MQGSAQFELYSVALACGYTSRFERDRLQQVSAEVPLYLVHKQVLAAPSRCDETESFRRIKPEAQSTSRLTFTELIKNFGLERLQPLPYVDATCTLEASKRAHHLTVPRDRCPSCSSSAISRPARTCQDLLPARTAAGQPVQSMDSSTARQL